MKKAPLAAVALVALSGSAQAQTPRPIKMADAADVIYTCHNASPGLYAHDAPLNLVAYVSPKDNTWGISRSFDDTPPIATGDLSNSHFMAHWQQMGGEYAGTHAVGFMAFPVATKEVQWGQINTDPSVGAKFQAFGAWYDCVGQMQFSDKMVRDGMWIWPNGRSQADLAADAASAAEQRRANDRELAEYRAHEALVQQQEAAKAAANLRAQEANPDSSINTLVRNLDAYNKSAWAAEHAKQAANIAAQTDSTQTNVCPSLVPEMNRLADVNDDIKAKAQRLVPLGNKAPVTDRKALADEVNKEIGDAKALRATVVTNHCLTDAQLTTIDANQAKLTAIAPALARASTAPVAVPAQTASVETSDPASDSLPDHPEAMYTSAKEINDAKDNIVDIGDHSHYCAPGYCAEEYVSQGAHSRTDYAYNITLTDKLGKPTPNGFFSVCTQYGGGDRACWTTQGKAWIDRPDGKGGWTTVHELRDRFPAPAAAAGAAPERAAGPVVAAPAAVPPAPAPAAVAPAPAPTDCSDLIREGRNIQDRFAALNTMPTNDQHAMLTAATQTIAATQDWIGRVDARGCQAPVQGPTFDADMGKLLNGWITVRDQLAAKLSKPAQAGPTTQAVNPAPGVASAPTPAPAATPAPATVKTAASAPAPAPQVKITLPDPAIRADSTSADDLAALQSIIKTNVAERAAITNRIAIDNDKIAEVQNTQADFKELQAHYEFFPCNTPSMSDDDLSAYLTDMFLRIRHSNYDWVQRQVPFFVHEARRNGGRLANGVMGRNGEIIYCDDTPVWEAIIAGRDLSADKAKLADFDAKAAKTVALAKLVAANIDTAKAREEQAAAKAREEQAEADAKAKAEAAAKQAEADIARAQQEQAAAAETAKIEQAIAAKRDEAARIRQKAAEARKAAADAFAAAKAEEDRAAAQEQAAKDAEEAAKRPVQAQAALAAPAYAANLPDQSLMCASTANHKDTVLVELHPSIGTAYYGTGPNVQKVKIAKIAPGSFTEIDEINGDKTARRDTASMMEADGISVRLDGLTQRDRLAQGPDQWAAVFADAPFHATIGGQEYHCVMGEGDEQNMLRTGYYTSHQDSPDEKAWMDGLVANDKRECREAGGQVDNGGFCLVNGKLVELHPEPKKPPFRNVCFDYVARHPNNPGAQNLQCDEIP
jgi:hypothetical protein